MSIETLLLLMFFIVLPLIETFRAARQRKQQQNRPDAAQTRPVPARRPPPPTMQTQLPSAWTEGPQVAPERPDPSDVPVVAAPVSASVGAPEKRQSMSDKIAARRRSAQRDAAAELALQPPAARNARPRVGDIGGLRSPGGLRQAFVSMAILGPCRAVDPHGWRESDTSR